MVPINLLYQNHLDQDNTLRPCSLFLWTPRSASSRDRRSLCRCRGWWRTLSGCSQHPFPIIQISLGDRASSVAYHGTTGSPPNRRHPPWEVPALLEDFAVPIERDDLGIQRITDTSIGRCGEKEWHQLLTSDLQERNLLPISGRKIQITCRCSRSRN